MVHGMSNSHLRKKKVLDGCSSCVSRGPVDLKQVPHGLVLTSVEHFQASNQIQILDSQSCVVGTGMDWSLRTGRFCILVLHDCRTI